MFLLLFESVDCTQQQHENQPLAYIYVWILCRFCFFCIFCSLLCSIEAPSKYEPKVSSLNNLVCETFFWRVVATKQPTWRQSTREEIVFVIAKKLPAFLRRILVGGGYAAKCLHDTMMADYKHNR